MRPRYDENGKLIGSHNMIFDDMPDNYHCLRVTTPWWESAPDFVPQVDGLTQEQSPFTFTFKASDKSNVETTGAMLFVGYGYKLTKVSYK